MPDITFIVPEGTPTGGRRAFMPDIIDNIIVPKGTPTINRA